MEERATNFLQVVERQCRRWELQQAERRARAPVHWPVITVSREFGARREALARLVALRTGFSFWDVELIHALAAESGASEAILRSLDEHRRNALEDSIEGALMGGQYMNSEFVRGLMRLIHTIASHGAGIIVGRGAQYVLAEPALRVRVVCPLGERIRGYASRRGLDERHARREVERKDQERRSFVRQYFSRDVADPSGYDVIVNTGTLALERARDVILHVYEAKFNRQPPLATEEGDRRSDPRATAGRPQFAGAHFTPRTTMTTATSFPLPLIQPNPSSRIQRCTSRQKPSTSGKTHSRSDLVRSLCTARPAGAQQPLAQQMHENTTGADSGTSQARRFVAQNRTLGARDS